MDQEPSFDQSPPQSYDGPITSISEPGLKTTGPLLFQLRKEVADLLGRNQTSFPGAQPVSFAKQHLTELKKLDYYVCEKSDGIRYLFYITMDENGNEAHYLIDRKNDYWYVNNGNLHFPQEGNIKAFPKSTLLDGELVWDKKPNGGREPRFLVFDCLVTDGNLLMDRPLDKRIAYLGTLLKPYKKLLADYPEEIEYQPFFVDMKPFQLSYGIDMMFKEVLPRLKHGNDGLIFTCRTTPYKPGTDPHILKWKPPEENSVDCRLKLNFPLVEPNGRERASGMIEPFIDYDSLPQAELLVYKGEGGPSKYEPFREVFISEEEWETLKGLGDPLDDRIVECNLDDQGRWRIMRFRDDKNEANHKSTVVAVLESINDRISEDDLSNAAPDIKKEWKARQERQWG